MPSMNRDQIAEAQAIAEESMQIMDNQSIAKSPHAGFVFLAKLDTSKSGISIPVPTDDEAPKEADILKEANAIDLVIARNSRAVIFKEKALDMSLHGHQQDNGVHYYTVKEITTGISSFSNQEIKNLPEEARLIRIMTPLIIEQGDETFYPITRRGGGTHKGLWGCSSKLLGERLTPEFTIAVASSELVVFSDHKIVYPHPDMKQRLPVIPNTVRFHGGTVNGEIECIKYDNPKERTLTLVFPRVAKIDVGANIELHNIEHKQDEVKLATKAELASGDIKLMPGLKEYLLG